MNRLTRILATTTALVLSAGLVTACGGGDAKSASGGDDGNELVGLFRFTPGAANGDAVSGTYFRMLQAGGDPQKGPYMQNTDTEGTAQHGEVTLLKPGSSGGLRTGGYQSQPNPAFKVVNGQKTDSLADAITMPTPFFGVRFSISTNKTDPQTQTEVPPPTVVLRGGKLEADMSSWAAAWNGQDFNQGAPKPVNSTDAKAAGQEQAERTWDWVAQKWLEAAPKSTVKGDGATGTYNPDTKAFTLEWTSYIDGGPFNGFTGYWHLEGVFEPAPRAPSDAK